MNEPLPLITDAEDITPEKCPEMYAELCFGCDQCDIEEDCGHE